MMLQLYSLVTPNVTQPTAKKVTGVKMYPMDYYWLTKDITLAE